MERQACNTLLWDLENKFFPGDHTLEEVLDAVLSSKQVHDMVEDANQDGYEEGQRAVIELAHLTG